jgi:hypothetical protein
MGMVQLIRRYLPSQYNDIKSAPNLPYVPTIEAHKFKKTRQDFEKEVVSIKLLQA